MVPTDEIFSWPDDWTVPLGIPFPADASVFEAGGPIIPMGLEIGGLSMFIPMVGGLGTEFAKFVAILLGNEGCPLDEDAKRDAII